MRRSRPIILNSKFLILNSHLSREHHIQIENTVLGVYFKLAAVLFHKQLSRFHAEPVVRAALGGLGKFAVVAKRAVVVVMHVDEHEPVIALDGKPDGATVGIEFFHRLDRVVHDVPEKRVQIGVAHKPEQFAVHNAIQFDVVLFAIQALFGEYDVERFVARANIGVVYGDYLVYLFYMAKSS